MVNAQIGRRNHKNLEQKTQNGGKNQDGRQA
jgi:hypothetical protein